MRLASFNMRSGGSAGHWAEILSAADPDILFVQESRDPHQFPPDLLRPLDVGGAVWEAVDHGKWGSSVLVRGADIRLMTVPGFSGWVVGGECEISGRTLQIFSVRLSDRSGPYVNKANLLLDALTPEFTGALPILGGDWNLTVSRNAPLPPGRRRSGPMRVIDRLEADFGLRSAWDIANLEVPPAQTLRWARDPATPYHCDGIFLPTAMAERVKRAEVVGGSPWLGLSDHNPLIVEIDWE